MPGENVYEEEQDEKNEDKNKFEDDPIIKNRAPSHSPINDLGDVRKPVS